MTRPGYFGGTYEYAGNGMDLFETFFGTSNPFASIIEGKVFAQ